MRRSSSIVLCLAFVFLLSAAYLYLRTFNSTAPPMTDAEAMRIIARGSKSLERKDVGAIVDMMSPDAKILNRSLAEVEGFTRTAVAQVSGHLSSVPRTTSPFNWKNGEPRVGSASYRRKSGKSPRWTQCLLSILRRVSRV